MSLTATLQQSLKWKQTGEHLVSYNHKQVQNNTNINLQIKQNRQTKSYLQSRSEFEQVVGQQCTDIL